MNFANYYTKKFRNHLSLIRYSSSKLYTYATTIQVVSHVDPLAMLVEWRGAPILQVGRLSKEMDTPNYKQ